MSNVSTTTLPRVVVEAGSRLIDTLLNDLKSLVLMVIATSLAVPIGTAIWTKFVPSPTTPAPIVLVPPPAAVTTVAPPVYLVVSPPSNDATSENHSTRTERVNHIPLEPVASLEHTMSFPEVAGPSSEELPAGSIVGQGTSTARDLTLTFSTGVAARSRQ